MKEYAFDVTLTAVVRVIASDERHARSMLALIDSVHIGWRGFDNLEITEASLAGTHQQLFEIDGEEV